MLGGSGSHDAMNLPIVCNVGCLHHISVAQHPLPAPCFKLVGASGIQVAVTGSTSATPPPFAPRAGTTCPASCNATLAGMHTVLSTNDVFLLPRPCRSFRPAGRLQKCQTVWATGSRTLSICGELTCYAEVNVNGTLYWVADHNCGKGAPSLLGLPGTRAPSCEQGGRAP